MLPWRPEEVATLEGARLDCNACGVCCRWFELGPVPPAQIERLKAADAGALVPDLGGEPFWDETDAGELFLRRRGGGCVFLGPDNRCRVHAALGEAMKPTMCRVFPLFVSDHPAGRRLGWSATCAGAHLGARTPIESRIGDAVALADDDNVGRVPAEGLAVAPGLVLPAETWVRLERSLIDAARTPRDDFDDVFVDLATQLDDAARAAGAGPEKAWPGNARDALYYLLADLFHRICVEEAMAVDAGTARTLVMHEVLRMLGGPAEPGPLTAAAAAFLREELANALFTGSFAELGSVSAGLGSFVFAVWLVRGHVAPPDGSPIEAGPLCEAWARWHHVYSWRSLAGGISIHRGVFAALFRTFAPPPPGSGAP